MRPIETAKNASGVGLLEHAATGQVRPVDGTDVVQPEKAALEEVVAVGVLPVDPPGEGDQQLVENPGQEIRVPAAVDGPDLERRPGPHGRVNVAEVPLVGGQRTVRVLEPLSAQQFDLVLGERRIDVRQRDAVEGHVPGGEPRVLPAVRHRHDVERVERPPLTVAGLFSLLRWRWLTRIAVQPAAHVEVVKLLAPQHARERLPHDGPLVLARRFRR
jgi:hypothetical protein